MSLFSFYGKECPHCEKMEPLVVQLEKETGVAVDRREVWYNDDNMKTLQKYDKDCCGGVPFFYNTETDKWICGEATYDELKAWAGISSEKK